jgi:NAD(P)-dependent dehydrogenase (short-subunit alcohol dehydrogenase family)
MIPSARRTAIVTGGARRLGSRIAVTLAESGFSVVVHYNKSKTAAENTVRLLRGHGAEAIAVRAELTDIKAINRLVQKTADRFGSIDLLVNNAAIFEVGNVLSVTEKRWDAAMDINLKAVFFLSRNVGQVMTGQKRGRIINIASVGAREAWANYIPYAISKMGVITLTSCLAKALAPHVMVNAISPGSIVIPGEEGIGRKHIPLKKIPLGRYGEPDDIASLVLYLATTAQYITGQTIAVDGGRSLI